MSRYDSTNDTKLATRVDCPVFCASVTSSAWKRHHRWQKPGNCRFFLTHKRFESQDFAGPLVAIARGEVPHLRRQALSASPYFVAPSWDGALKTAVHHGGVALPGPRQASVRSLLETSLSTAMRCLITEMTVSDGCGWRSLGRTRISSPASEMEGFSIQAPCPLRRTARGSATGRSRARRAPKAATFPRAEV